MTIARLALAPLALSIVMLSTGCQQDAPATPQDTSAVLITHGATQVTQRDLEAELARYPENARTRILGNEAQIRQILESIAIRRALAQEATQAHLQDKPEIRYMLKHAEERALADLWLQELEQKKLGGDIEQLALEQYTANKDRYKQPEQIHAAHILIKTGTERSKEEARKLAEEVLVKAKAGEPFEELARQYSEDTSAKKGGDLGFFAKGRMVKPFEEAAFALAEPGQLSDPVETQFGFHIIKLLERKPEHMLSFEEVKPQLLQQSRARFAQQFRMQYTNELKAKAPLNYDDAAMKALQAPTTNQGAITIGGGTK